MFHPPLCLFLFFRTRTHIFDLHSLELLQFCFFFASPFCLFLFFTSPFCLFLFFRTRTHIVVKGLGPIGSSGSSSGLSRNQEILRGRLTSVLSLFGSDFPFVVRNVIVFPPVASPVYDVELDTSGAVDALIRETFKFSRKQDPVKPPPELERITLYHSVTPATRIRIALLRVSPPPFLPSISCFLLVVLTPSSIFGRASLFS